MSKHKILISILSSLLIIAASSSFAGDGRWYINPAIGIQNFDSDRDLDSDTTLSIGGEYRYNDQWASEVRFLDSSPDADMGGNVDLKQYYVDGLYYFQGMQEKWQPFVVVGLGLADFDSGNEYQANAGVGTRYSLNDNWSLRGDVRSLFATGNWDSLINFGVSYAFGSSKKAAAAPIAAGNPDSDADGVPNSRDNCPNTPAGASVDASGCALDSDGDGVPDYRDRCLNTPKSYEVNSDGCMLTRAKEVSFDLSLRFAHDSDVLQDYNRQEVQRIANYLKDNKGATGIIEGHTDSSGAAAYNQKLSERRAKTVEMLLVKKFGVDTSRLSSVGYGEDRPIADNNTARGRDVNRRVVAKVRHKTEENIKK